MVDQPSDPHSAGPFSIDPSVAQRIVDDLRAAITAGSYLVFAHTSLDIAVDGAGRAIDRVNQTLDEPYVTRTRAQVSRLLAGLALIEPGLVPVEHWRPSGGGTRAPEGRPPVPIYGAVGRKPGA